MECLGCGSAAVSERSERTAQGYRRFRCRTCGKQFNERSAGSLNRTQYPSDVIALVVLWRLRYRDRLKPGGLCRAPEWTTGPAFGDGMITVKGAVHHRASNLEHQVRTARRPAHLLLGIHP